MINLLKQIYVSLDKVEGYQFRKHCYKGNSHQKTKPKQTETK